MQMADLEKANALLEAMLGGPADTLFVGMHADVGCWAVGLQLPCHHLMLTNGMVLATADGRLGEI